MIYLLLFLLLVRMAAAATNSVADTELATIQSAVNSATDGDTILVPSGSSTWDDKLTIAKGISVIGAGTNATAITCNSQAVQIGSASAGLARLSGFRFTGYPTNHCVVIASAPNCPVRVDRCLIENFSFAFYSYGVGVVDHCTIVQCGRLARTSCPSPTANPTKLQMAYPWSNWKPTVLDTTNAMYYEDVHGIWANYNNGTNAICSAQDAGGYVVRRCTFDLPMTGSYNGMFDAHGNQGDITSESTIMRGTYQVCIYSNTFTCTGPTSDVRFGLIRGGSGLIFSNTVTGTSFSSTRLEIYEEDADGQWDYTGPPYYDQITNLWIFNNTMSMPVQPYAETLAIKDNGAYWDVAVPPSITTLIYPHPLITAQDEPTPPPTPARWLPFFYGRKP